MSKKQTELHSNKEPQNELAKLLLVGLFLCIFCLFALIYSRWPLILFPDILNPDEAQFAACAVTATVAPLPYVVWDPTSSGPLNVFPLMWPVLFGQPITLATGRLTAVAALALTSALLFIAASYPGKWIAGIASATLFLLFHLFTSSPDFTHFSSEMIPNVLLASGFACAIIGFGNPKKNILFLLAGMFFACTPLAKWQSAPMALLLFAGTCIMILYIFQDSKVRFRALAFLSLGGMIPVVLLGFSLTATGRWEYFHFAVVKASLGYAGQSVPDLSSRITLVRQLVESMPDYYNFLVSVTAFGSLVLLACAAISFLPHQKEKNKKNQSSSNKHIIALVFLSFLWCGAAVITQFTTGRDFPHYLLFTVPAFCLMVGGLAKFLNVYSESRKLKSSAAILFFLALSALAYWLSASKQEVDFKQNTTAPFTQTAEVLNQVAKDGDRLAVWGWMFELHTQTGLPFAFPTLSLHNISFFPSDLHPWLLKIYSDSLAATRPEWFFETLGAPVEMTASIPISQKTIASQPIIAEILEKNYQIVAETDEGRLHARKDVVTRMGGYLPQVKSFFDFLSTGNTIPLGQFRRYPDKNAWFLGVPSGVPFVVPVPEGVDEFSVQIARPPKVIRWNVQWIKNPRTPEHFSILAAKNDIVAERIASTNTVGLTQQELRGKIPHNTDKLVLLGEQVASSKMGVSMIGIGRLSFFSKGEPIKLRY